MGRTQYVKAILGGTLTSQADGASSTNALGNVHNEVRFEVRSSDATQVAATLTRDLGLSAVLC
uniref:phage portal protein family protein n=1 Tax=Erwinia tracheiphila TaxID=65700 RepID=UPI00398B6B75